MQILRRFASIELAHLPFRSLLPSQSYLLCRSSRSLHSHSFAVCIGLKRFVGIEKDCDWAFVNEFDRHPRLEDARGDGDAEVAQGFAKLFVQFPGYFRWRCGDVTRPALTARVAVESKL